MVTRSAAQGMSVRCLCWQNDRKSPGGQCGSERFRSDLRHDRQHGVAYCRVKENCPNGEPARFPAYDARVTATSQTKSNPESLPILGHKHLQFVGKVGTNGPAVRYDSCETDNLVGLQGVENDADAPPRALKVKDVRNQGGKVGQRQRLRQLLAR